MKKAFVKHHSDKEMITVNALMTQEFFCNGRSFHDNGMQYVNMGFTSMRASGHAVCVSQTVKSSLQSTTQRMS